EVGVWRSDVLSWLMAGFVLVIGLVIQRYCIRYLAGDKSYKKYFTLFTFTTAFAALAWLTADMRIMVVCWGITFLGLTLLIRLTNAWQVTRIAARSEERRVGKKRRCQ